MPFVCLMAFLLIGQEPTKDPPPALQWQRAVEVKAEPIKLGADGAEIVTIRMKIKPGYHVYATPQPNEFLQSTEMKLILKSSNPATKFDITYPKGIEVGEKDFLWSKNEGDFTITALVQRAKGDESPVNCVLRFHPMQRNV